MHDRALLYYRLLRANVAEAERIVNPPLQAVMNFSEALTQDMRDAIFDEFNTLSVVYQVRVRGFGVASVWTRRRGRTLATRCVIGAPPFAARCLAALCSDSALGCAAGRGARCLSAAARRGGGESPASCVVMVRVRGGVWRAQLPSASFLEPQGAYQSLLTVMEAPAQPARCAPRPPLPPPRLPFTRTRALREQCSSRSS